MLQILQSLKSGETILAEVPAPKVRKGSLLIATGTTLVSSGTERMLVDFGKSGWIQKARSQPDKVKAVIDKEGKVYAADIVPIFLSNILDRPKDTNLPENSVNKVFICDTYHHFELPKNALASLSKALRADGEIILVDLKREEGASSDWIMNHVRAGESVFCREIESAGFEKTASYDILKDNYMVRFRKK